MSLIALNEQYQKLADQLKDELAVRNYHALPKIVSVSINTGIGKIRTDKDKIERINHDLGLISGQKPATTKAKKSISNFKIRTGDPIGFKITLRGRRMNDFLNRLINITLPRVRDFHGLKLSDFDRNGNLTIGFKDTTSFAELGHTALDNPFGLSVTIVITRSNPEKSLTLLKTLGLPVNISLQSEKKKG